jgi:hypothetical protein
MSKSRWSAPQRIVSANAMDVHCCQQHRAGPLSMVQDHCWQYRGERMVQDLCRQHSGERTVQDHCRWHCTKSIVPNLSKEKTTTTTSESTTHCIIVDGTGDHCRQHRGEREDLCRIIVDGDGDGTEDHCRGQTNKQKSVGSLITFQELNLWKKKIDPSIDRAHLPASIPWVVALFGLCITHCRQIWFSNLLGCSYKFNSKSAHPESQTIRLWVIHKLMIPQCSSKSWDSRARNKFKVL